MWELDHKESWALKKRCFWTVMLEKTLEIPMDSKEIQSVHPKGNQSWIFIGRTDAEAEAPILWPSDMKSQLIGKDPDAGKDCRQEEKGTTEDKIDGWHHQLNGQEFEQAPEMLKDQGNLACCSPWGRTSWTQLSDWTTNGWQGVHPLCYNCLHLWLPLSPLFPVTDSKSLRIDSYVAVTTPEYQYFTPIAYFSHHHRLATLLPIIFPRNPSWLISLLLQQRWSCVREKEHRDLWVSW